MPRGSGSVDKAPDSQWIYTGSKLERHKYSFITIVCFRNLYTLSGASGIPVPDQTIEVLMSDLDESAMAYFKNSFSSDPNVVSKVHCPALLFFSLLLRVYRSTTLLQSSVPQPVVSVCYLHDNSELICIYGLQSLNYLLDILWLRVFVPYVSLFFVYSEIFIHCTVHRRLQWKL